MNKKINKMIAKKEKTLRQKQEKALQALLKRIQRDRNEQLWQWQIDSEKLIQRNRNIMNDLIQKQQVETKKAL